jgi:hypothetical protein
VKPNLHLLFVGATVSRTEQGLGLQLLGGFNGEVLSFGFEFAGRGIAVISIIS